MKHDNEVASALQELNAMEKIKNIEVAIPAMIKLLSQEVKNGEISAIAGLARIKTLLRVGGEE